jgi:chemotaxis protein CheC
MKLSLKKQKANMLPARSINIQEVSDNDVLQEIGSIGAGHASIALSTVLHEQVNVEVPRLHTAPPHLFPRIYNEHDTVVAAIFMQLRDQLDCDLMLIFETEEAKKIAALMASSAEDSAVDAEMEKSALEELGSIMLGSFLSAIADFTGTELVPTPPQLIHDVFDAVIDGLLAKQALCSEIAAIFDVRFKRNTGSAEGYLIMFPSDNLKEILTQKGKAWLETSLTGKTAELMLVEKKSNIKCD